MPIKRYEISDYQWNQIKHLFPTAKTGRPPKDNRMVFNAILWITQSGSAWRDLPERLEGRHKERPGGRQENIWKENVKDTWKEDIKNAREEGRRTSGRKT